MAMIFTGTYAVPAERERVWQGLNDPAVLAASIPGCSELTATVDGGFAATIVARIGVISATFRGDLRIEDADPPHGYALVGRADGGLAGFAKGRAEIALADGETAGTTVLTYRAETDIGGKVAMVGGRLIQSVAKSMADAFFEAFVAEITGGTGSARRIDGEAPPAPASTAAPAAGPIGAPAPVAVSAGPATIGVGTIAAFFAGIAVGILATAAATVALGLLR
jgi:carbon monoxide dehydrogenase subunit G